MFYRWPGETNISGKSSILASCEMFIEAGSQTAIVLNSAAVCSPLLHDRPSNALGFSTFLKGIDENMKLNKALRKRTCLRKQRVEGTRGYSRIVSQKLVVRFLMRNCSVQLRVSSLLSRSEAFQTGTVLFLLPRSSEECGKRVGSPSAPNSKKDLIRLLWLNTWTLGKEPGPPLKSCF